MKQLFIFLWLGGIYTLSFAAEAIQLKVINNSFPVQCNKLGWIGANQQSVSFSHLCEPLEIQGLYKIYSIHTTSGICKSNEFPVYEFAYEPAFNNYYIKFIKCKLNI